MSQQAHPFTLYFFRTADKPGWTPGLLTVPHEAAAETITGRHPGAAEIRFVVQGVSAVPYAGDLPEDKYGRLDDALDAGWWYDTTRHCWLSPDENAMRPVEKPLPAAMSLVTDEPCDGWWFWHMGFTPLVSNDAAIWRHLFDGEESIRYDMDCSGVYDPVARLDAFVDALRAGQDARWVVNEEGGFTGFLAWHDGAGRVHLRLMSLCRERDRKYDLLIATAEVVDRLEAARAFFDSLGGWGESE